MSGDYVVSSEYFYVFCFVCGVQYENRLSLITDDNTKTVLFQFEFYFLLAIESQIEGFQSEIL